MGSDEQAFITKRDGAMVAMLSALALVSWILPERCWWFLAKRLATFGTCGRSSLSADEIETLRVVVGNRSDQWIDKQFRSSSLSHKYLHLMYLLSCHRPWARGPKPTLIGAPNIDQALEHGQGALLFTATLAHNDLMTKAALARAGFEVSHLSQDTHGFSKTVFGKRWLNPVLTSIEERHLKERMVFSGGNTKAVNARLKERLRQNDLVMVTVTPLGRNVETLPFLHGRIHIATGALNFACETGAPVLPVFTLRQYDGSFATFVGAALDRPEGMDRSDQIRAMLADYVSRLAACVRCYPEQFSFPISERHGKALISPRERAVSAPTEQEPLQPAA